MLIWLRGFSFVNQETRCLFEQAQPVNGNAISVMNFFRSNGILRATGEEHTINLKIQLNLLFTGSHSSG
jgi:hypothetical protein